MPKKLITCQDGLSDEQKSSVKDHIKAQGGTITDESSLITMYTVDVPETSVNALKTHKHIVAVEDGDETVTTKN